MSPETIFNYALAISTSIFYIGLAITAIVILIRDYFK